MLVAGFVCRVVYKEYFIKACVKSRVPCESTFTRNIPSTFTFPSTGFPGFLFDSNTESSVGSYLPAVLSRANLLLWSIVFQNTTLVKKSFSLFKCFSPPIYNTESTMKTIFPCFQLWLSVINLVLGSPRCSAWAQAFCLQMEFIWSWT